MSDTPNPQDEKAVAFLRDVAAKELQIAEEYLPEDNRLREAFDELYVIVVERMEELIDHDFESLLLLLYRTDVNETKLKAELDSNPPEKAAEIIARMFIARQLEKHETRKKYSGNHDEGQSWVEDL
jgi:hypothetical protein